LHQLLSKSVLNFLCVFGIPCYSLITYGLTYGLNKMSNEKIYVSPINIFDITSKINLFSYLEMNVRKNGDF